MEPNRNPLQDHFVDKASWPWSYLPSFVKEPSFVLSSDLVPRLLMAATTLDMLSVEQVCCHSFNGPSGHGIRLGVSGLVEGWGGFEPRHRYAAFYPEVPQQQ